MNAFLRSWDLTKSSFRVMKQDKEIFMFPVLAIITFILFFVLFGVFAFFAGVISLIGGIKVAVLGYFLLFVMYLVLGIISTFFAVCVVYTASMRFNNKDATLGQSISFAMKRFGRITWWALLSATVGLLIKMLENVAHKAKGVGKIVMSIITSLVGMAWAISTIFVIQGIVYKDLSPFSAIKDSVITLKKTWGESLIRYIGFGIIEWVVTLIGMMILVPMLIVSVLSQSIIGILVIASLIIIYIALVALTFSIAESVFNTALYIYANTGKVPAGFSAEQMKETFKSQPKEGLAILG